jgi:hypothetical protein
VLQASVIVHIVFIFMNTYPPGSLTTVSPVPFTGMILFSGHKLRERDRQEEAVVASFSPLTPSQLVPTMSQMNSVHTLEPNFF